MRTHRKIALAFTFCTPLLMAADCGHGGGSPCPQRGEAFSDDGPDAGVGVAPDEGGEAQAIGTGGGGGGGGPDECRRE